MKSENKSGGQFAFTLAATFLFINASDATTIAVNSGSFEAPAADGFATTDWANLDLAWENGPAAGLEYEQNSVDNINADNGTWSVFLPNAGNISQDLLTAVSIGDTLSVTFSGGRANASSSVNLGGVFSATFDVGGVDYTSTFDTTGLAFDSWTSFTLTKTITNAGNLSLEFAPVSDHPWLDTVSSVTVVPEPGSLSLLALGGLGLLRRRRA